MTQCEKVIEYIQQYGSITTYDAFIDLNITRLSSRIHDLTNQGYDFDRKYESRKNRYGETVSYVRYTLKDGNHD